MDKEIPIECEKRTSIPHNTNKAIKLMKNHALDLLIGGGMGARNLIFGYPESAEKWD